MRPEFYKPAAKMGDEKSLKNPRFLVRLLHNAVLLITWILMLASKNWLRGRPNIIFLGTFILYVFHWLMPLFQTIKYNRRPLGYEVLSTFLSLAICIVIQVNYHHQDNDQEFMASGSSKSINTTITVFSWFSFAFFLVELMSSGWEKWNDRLSRAGSYSPNSSFNQRA